MSRIVERDEDDALAVGREAVMLHEEFGQQTLSCTGWKVDGPEFTADEGPARPSALEVIQTLAVRRKRGQERISLRSNLVISCRVVKPDRALLFTDRRDERTPVGREGNPLFFGSTKSHLLGRAVRVALT